MRTRPFAGLLLTIAACPGEIRTQQDLEIASASGAVRASLRVRETDLGARPELRVRFGDVEALHWSSLGLALDGGTMLGDRCALDTVERAEFVEEFRQHPGKRSRVRVAGTELTATLTERGPEPWRWQIVVRACDDGVAFRYVVPAQVDHDELTLAGERTSLALLEAGTAHALPLGSFTTSHEARYTHSRVGDLPQGALLGIPLLIELPGPTFVAITEAALRDHAGLYFVPGRESRLESRLSPLPDESGVAVRAPLPHSSPWRVLQVAADPGRLVESDLVLALNEPCALDDVSWIVPGKTTFPWWNGYVEPELPIEPDLDTRTSEYYVDFCAEAGIPYHSLDGKGPTAWYGGRIVPYEGSDPATAIEGLDLPRVLSHARERGVRLRLWMHWQAAREHMHRVFPLYREWGIEGVMIDFMDRDDQQMVRFQEELLRLAADNRLTVTFHGVAKPTGLERTWPNLLTSEGVLNLEYDKWSAEGVSPGHELTVVFTRMLAGPLDFHQGAFRTVTAADFAPRNRAPVVIGTIARTLASYVVLQNHLPMVADYPSAYRGHSALPLLAAIPCTWDDTVVCAAEVGELAVIARRSGSDWWLGAMNGDDARTLEIALEFLGPGRFAARVCRDAASGANELSDVPLVTADTRLPAKLAPAGGLLVHFRRRPD